MLSNLELPWHELWLPKGALPFWSMVLVWIFGVIVWFARPLLRARLLHFAFFLLVLLPGAAMWSLLLGMREIIGLSRLIGMFDPILFMDSLDHALKVSGILLATFLLVTFISALLYWRHLVTRRVTHASGLEASLSQRDDS